VVALMTDGEGKDGMESRQASCNKYS
jgi:hypothetical protein